VLVEEVGPRGQRDRGARQRLGLGEPSAGGQDPGQEALGDHLGQDVLTRAGVPAHRDETLGLDETALGRDRLGQERCRGGQHVLLAHLFETLVVAAQVRLGRGRVTGQHGHEARRVGDRGGHGRAQLLEGGQAPGQDLPRLLGPALHGVQAGQMVEDHRAGERASVQLTSERAAEQALAQQRQWYYESTHPVATPAQPAPSGQTDTPVALLVALGVAAALALGLDALSVRRKTRKAPTPPPDRPGRHRPDGAATPTRQPHRSSAPCTGSHLSHGIQPAACLVQDDHLGPAVEESSRDHQPLPLPTRQVGSPLELATKQGLHAVGKVGDDVLKLVGLRVKRVDLLHGRVTVAEQVAEVNGQLLPGLPKTEAGRRTVTLPAVAAVAPGRASSGVRPARPRGAWCSRPHRAAACARRTSAPPPSPRPDRDLLGSP
jgi:hypothetical protein